MGESEVAGETVRRRQEEGGAGMRRKRGKEQTVGE